MLEKNPLCFGIKFSIALEQNPVVRITSSVYSKMGESLVCCLTPKCEVRSQRLLLHLINCDLLFYPYFICLKKQCPNYLHKHMSCFKKKH